MRIPFWPRRRPTELVVTFTQKISVETLRAFGTPGIFAGGVTVAITCPCGATMSGNNPPVQTLPNSVTMPHHCPACRNRVNIAYVCEVEQERVATTITPPDGVTPDGREYWL